MSASKQNFLQAHWDWLVAVVGVLALVAAVGLYALTMGDVQSPESYRMSLESKSPANEGVQPADLSIFQKSLRGAKSPVQIPSVDPKKASFLASERRVLCRQGDAGSKKKACGRPIPSGCETCPFCGAKQIVVKVEVDTDHDGMPNDWEKKYGLNPNDPSDAAKDADGDGFTNLEEFTAGTDPKNKMSHPDYLDSVSVVGGLKQTTLPFYFNNVTPIPGGHRFTFQRIGMKGFDAKVSAKMNEEVVSPDRKSWKSGWKVTKYEQKTEQRQIPGSKLKRPVDVSTIDIERIADRKKMTIRVGERNVPIESQVELQYTRGEGKKFVVATGTEFELNGMKYRVVKLGGNENGGEATILDLQRKKEKTVR